MSNAIVFIIIEMSHKKYINTYGLIKKKGVVNQKNI
jgi:hypothetical protein